MNKTIETIARLREVLSKNSCLEIEIK